MSEHEPRIYLHPDGAYVSIGFDDTNDTLLPMPDREAGWRNWERAAEWIAAVDAILSARTEQGQGRA